MKVTLNGRHTDDFTVSWDQAKNMVTAEYNGKSELPADATVRLEYDAVVHAPAVTGLVEGVAGLVWNDGDRIDSQSSSFRQWRPSPDAVWIGWDEANERWVTATDPDGTGAAGVSGARVLDGDRLALAVNATTPTGTGSNLDGLELTADWSAAGYLFAPDEGKAMVIETETSDVTKPTVDDMIAKGRDVTGRFTLTSSDGTLKAVMKPAWLAETKGRQFTLIVPGTASFANGKGVGRLLSDQGLEQGSELDLCARDGKAFTATGSQRVNSQTVTAGSVQVCAYVPPVTKRVTSSRLMDGDRSDIDGKLVSPGDKLEYQLISTPSLPRLAYQVNSLELTDAYDPNTTIDVSSIEVRDSSGPLASDQWERELDPTNHRLTIRLTGDRLKEWRDSGRPRIEVTFTATVDSTRKTDAEIRNVWGVRINKATAISNTVGNRTCDAAGACTPGTNGTAGETAVSIDGRSMLLGDRFNYRVTISASKLTDTAYRVWRLGAITRFDAKHLTLDASNIKVVDQTTGKDVTDRFNIQTDGSKGRVWAFLKTVDTRIASTGETIPGDPQPVDLEEYAALDEHDPLKDPAIDQGMLGHDYVLVLPMLVSKADAETSVNATSMQVTDRVRTESKPVSSTIMPIMPGQDTTVTVGGDSLDGSSVYQGEHFLYRMDSSILPANRAIQTVSEWRLDAQFDTGHDDFTGSWAVYAATDLYAENGVKIASRGERIAGNDYANPNGELFTLTSSGDGSLSVKATERFLAMAGANTRADQAWRAYAQFTRIAPGDGIGVTVTETLNGQQRQANSVTTRTPDQTPRLTVTKWDEASGQGKGDRDTTDQALALKDGGTRIVFTIRNDSGVDENGQGPWFKASDLELSDRLVAGDGTVSDLEYPADWDTLVLKPGDSVNVTGTLTGVATHHTDRASVTGTPLVSCPADTEPPFGKTTGDDDADAGKETGSKAIVEVEGRTLCRDTKVVSQSDDWNAYDADFLANTGTSNGLVALIIAGVLLLAGACVLLAAQRTGHLKHAGEARGDESMRSDLDGVSDPDGE